MKYLIEWIFKILISATIGSIAAVSLWIISLLLWGKRFLDMGDAVLKYIWIKNKIGE